MAVELRYYRYFLAVAEELHFGKAAARLHIAQPALSIQIRQLENKVGGPLFERSSRKVRLTEAGELFRREAKLLLEQEERSFRKVSRMLRGQAGVLNLGYTGTAIFSGIMGEVLKKYRKACPDVEIRLRELDPNRQLFELENRSLHAGFMTVSFLSPPGALAMLPLASWPMLLALPADHRLARKKRVTMEMLREEAFIAYAGENYEDAAMLRFIAGFRPKVAFEASSIIIMTAMVDAGLGVALVPAWLNRAHVRFNVVYKSVPEITAKMDYCLGYRRDEDGELLKSFVRFVAGTRPGAVSDDEG